MNIPEALYTESFQQLSATHVAMECADWAAAARHADQLAELCHVSALALEEPGFARLVGEKWEATP